MNNNESELTVITRAKELSIYILTVTDKSPKKFRFTLVSRLQGYSLDIIENLYMANQIRLVKSISDDEINRRKAYQDKAMTMCRLLGYMAMVAREISCILPKQHEIIANKIIEVQKLPYSWQQSDIKRLSYRE